MRTTTMPVFAAMTLSSAAIFLAVACGGGQTGDAKDPTGAAASSAPSATPAASGTPASGGGDTTSPGAGGTTTTMQLGDAGDLQGAKLGSATRKEIEIKGDGGPKTPPGGKSDEPGRRVDDIRVAVQARRDEARACYDKALPAHPGIEGDLDVKWVINPDGTVGDVSVDQHKSSIHEESVGNCVVGIIKTMKFAPSQKGFETRAHYPFNFHPKASQLKDAGK